MTAASSVTSLKGFLTRLLRNRAGNTIALITAALIPLLALVGGGVDMGRSYLSQTRLQQACDAGVLAARKKLAAQPTLTGAIPYEVEQVGQRYFNINFADGAYGTEDRTFQLSLQPGDIVAGEASVAVPTTIMAIFGEDEVDLQANCQAKLNFSNTDIMFVLDTTGSMSWSNPGDTSSRLEVLKQVVHDFTAKIEDGKTAGTRVRYGFVPYSTNVNVGFLLKSDWVVDEWSYHGREAKDTGVTETYDTFDTTYTTISGSSFSIAPYVALSCPANTITYTTLSSGTDAQGNDYGTELVNGSYYWCDVSADGSMVTVSGVRYDNYKYSWLTQNTGTATRNVYKWQYRKMPFDVSMLNGPTGDDPLVGGSLDVRMYGYPSPTPEIITATFQGCIEERATYEIEDFNNVDLSRALDLEIDMVPSPGDPDTQWRPMFHEISYEPEIWWDGTGTFKTPVTTSNDYLMAGWAGLSACPARSRLLSEMTVEDVDGYLDTLEADGSTYHDIGMIWGGRLISPTGLFATQNADVDGLPTSRHLIFLTDGETAPYDLSYGTYGIEPLDKRRWSENSSMSLTEVVEGRFGIACSEVKKRNVTVWVIGFGTSLNPAMTQCAGAGHYFEASDASELAEVFSKIAAQLGDLRISK